MKNKKVFIVLLTFVVLLVVAYFLFLLSKSRTFQFFGNLTNRVDTPQKVIALTFDDAPSPFSDQVVDMLSAKGVKATFYMVGQNIESFPKQAKYIVDHGHEVGNHSYSHERFLLKSLSFVKSEIDQTNKLIRKLDYQEQITFRPPNGKKLFTLPWYLAKQNIQTITWDVEPDTFLPPTGNIEERVKFLVDYTVSNTKPGSIILIHPLCQSCQADRQALEIIIDKLQSDGYVFVTISELLSYQAKN